MVPERIHTSPMERHWEFLGERGLKSQTFGRKVLSQTGISGWVRGCKTKKPSVGGVCIFSGAVQWEKYVQKQSGKPCCSAQR